MEKMFWTTGEVVEMLDVTPSLIRFWETRFEFLAPRKNDHGRRRWSAEDVANLKTVYHLVKERGMTLDGAARHLRANRRATDRDAAIAERLQRVRATLVEIRTEMDFAVRSGADVALSAVSEGEDSTKRTASTEEQESATDARLSPQNIEQTLFPL